MILPLLFSSLLRALDPNLACDLALDFDLALTLNLDLARDLASTFAKGELKQKLQQLEDELPDTSREKRDLLKQWWKANGEEWTERLRQLMINEHNIEQEWQFSLKEVHKLAQYYEANKLLVDCLNSECYVSRSVREEIEATLLLPIDRRQE